MSRLQDTLQAMDLLAACRFTFSGPRLKILCTADVNCTKQMIEICYYILLIAYIKQQCSVL